MSRSPPSHPPISKQRSFALRCQLHLRSSVSSPSCVPLPTHSLSVGEWRSLGVHETFVDFRSKSQKNQIKEKGKRPWKLVKLGSGPTAMGRNALSTAVRQLNF